MVVTMLVELVLFIYILYRYTLHTTTKLIAAIIFLLATFQLAESRVCSGVQAEVFMRIGFVAITILPALGFHLVFRIARKKNTYALAVSYAFCALFAIILGFRSSSFVNNTCGGNYAIFTIADKVGGLYFTYYYILLFLSIGLSLYFAHTANKKTRKALLWQVFGLLSFLLPTGIVNTLRPDTLKAIPSIMCGFAVIYAFVLVFAIAPTICTKKKAPPTPWNKMPAS